MFECGLVCFNLAVKVWFGECQILQLYQNGEFGFSSDFRSKPTVSQDGIAVLVLQIMLLHAVRKGVHTLCWLGSAFLLVIKVHE